MFKKFLFVAALSATFASCNDDDDSTRDPLPIPAAYNGTNYDANTATQSAVATNLNAQVTAAKQGRNAGTTVSIAQLETPYNDGNPSVRAVSTTYYVGEMEGPNGYMAQLVAASGGTFTPGDLTGQGGVYGPYLFDENGLEYEQLIEKGQFGAVLYKHATDLLSGNVSDATVDQIITVFGASPAFPNTNNAANTPTPDRFMANYGARRDKNDGNGLYSQMKNEFIKLQAAVKAGAEYDAEKQQAIDAIKLNWEKINAATIINYCHGATSTLSESSPTDAQKAGALHAIGEAIGFAHGWKTIPANYKLFTDAEIDEVLTLLNAPAAGTPTVYAFATNPLVELPKLQQVITMLQDIYGFTDQEVEDFRQNWVTVQNR